jgi:cytochrome b involved in lipid metabolism
MTTLKERLSHYLKTKKIGVSEFERSLGMAPSHFYKVNSIGSDLVAKISKEYPDLDLNWLLTEKGEMLKIRTVDRMIDYINAMGDDVERVDKELWGGTDIVSELFGRKRKATFFKYYEKHTDEDANFRALNHFMKHYAFDINPTWLFTGKGAMLKTEDEKKCKNCEELTKRIGVLEYQLERLKSKKK